VSHGLDRIADKVQQNLPNLTSMTWHRRNWELWPEMGDGADQAAQSADVADSATPSVNLTPAMTIGN
jgi:hypothetical protein